MKGIQIVGRYRILIICMDFKAINSVIPIRMLYFVVVKIFVITQRVRTSNSALVKPQRTCTRGL